MDVMEAYSCVLCGGAPPAGVPCGFFIGGIMEQHYQACIDACNECAAACDHCAASCLQEQEVKMLARCIALDTDCSQLCRLAAGFMARGSSNAAELCRACAEIC